MYMKLTFNNGEVLETQSVEEINSSLKIRTINKSIDELRALFSDTFKTRRIVVSDNRDTKVFDNYTELEYTAEYSGGIREVSIIKEGETVEQRLEKNASEITELQLALCEVYEMMGV